MLIVSIKVADRRETVGRLQREWNVYSVYCAYVLASAISSTLSREFVLVHPPPIREVAGEIMSLMS